MPPQKIELSMVISVRRLKNQEVPGCHHSITRYRAGPIRLTASFFQADGFADAVSEVVKLGPANDGRSLDFDFGNTWRMEWEFTLDTLSRHDPSD